MSNRATTMLRLNLFIYREVASRSIWAAAVSSCDSANAARSWTAIIKIEVNMGT
ncbi:hypothetical protein [Desulfopila aestuarii]|uniref:hypothetical protein n=1 Tax=Desulfopila aestuarii TaxID=231440 RepID=UPI001356662E|nr:hypothetical protein [Desulfopila aestuarii]